MSVLQKSPMPGSPCLGATSVLAVCSYGCARSAALDACRLQPDFSKNFHGSPRCPLYGLLRWRLLNLRTSTTRGARFPDSAHRQRGACAMVTNPNALPTRRVEVPTGQHRTSQWTLAPRTAIKSPSHSSSFTPASGPLILAPLAPSPPSRTWAAGLASA